MRVHMRLFALIVFVSLAAISGRVCAQQQPAPASPLPASLEAALRLIPADAHAAIVVPHLKRASDHLTRMLEGMDRAGLLVGSRPIDHFKSITGFATAVDDNGAAVLVVMDSGAPTQRLAWLVPVTDAEEFLAANFTALAEQPDARRSADGRVFYARGMQSHVLLSADSQTIHAFDLNADEPASLPKQIGELRPAGAADIDAIIVARAPLIASLRQRVLKPAADMGVALPGIAVAAIKTSERIETAVLFVQCDPLALVVRSATIFQHASAIGATAVADAPVDAGLARLPKQPAALAMSINLAALGGYAAILDTAKAHSIDPTVIPSWLALCDAMQLRIAPSPAGATGGLLNGASILIAGNDPKAIIDAIKRDVIAGGEGQSPARQSKWADNASLPEAATAAAFEIRSVNPAPGQAMVESLLFGAAGLRGYVAAADDSAVITFAQRPALLAESLDAAKQAALAKGHATGLAADSAVKIMRQWMPAQRDIEGYIGTGQAAELLQAVTGGMPGAAEAVPDFDASLPPVGFAIDVAPRRVDGALIVPAGVLAQALDEVLRHRAVPRE